MPKKGGKKSSKKDKKGGKKKNDEKDESIAKMAARNSNIWEARLKMTEFHKDHYKETVRQLAEENTSLIDHMKQNEKDTIDVVAYLRKIDADKQMEVDRLQHELKHIEKRHHNEKEAIMNELNTKLNDCQDKLKQKINEAEILQNELTQLKEFRKRKVQMQKELEDIKEAMVMNEREHKEQMVRIEEKFFEEKMRLQIEANKKIEELAEKAHDAAVKNLDEITRNIYKENVQLTESYKLNNKEIESLRKLNKQLANENERLRALTEGNAGLVKEKVEQATRQGKLIKDLQSKVQILEKSLSQVVREFEQERDEIMRKSRTDNEANVVEVEKLRRTLELRNKEMNKVKKLAKNILEQRSDIERYFLESLDFVRKQVATNRNDYRKEANAVYNNKMLAAHLGQIEYPKVRTFSKKFEANSTNSVFKDLEQAEKWYDVNELADIDELTWEQKEQVLRELFARMNGAKANSKSLNQQSKALVKVNSNPNLVYDSNDDEDENDLNANLKPIHKQKKANNKSSNSNKNDRVTFITQVEHNELENENRSSQDSNKMTKLPSIISPLVQ